MPSVDDRIVRMEFNNASFEAKLKQTLSSLSQLDKALKLTGAAKGLSEVGAAAKKVDLNPLTNAASSVSAGFLTLSTVAVTALATITHAAITSGAQMVKGLSLDPVLDGFREYEQNIGSIQTILANTRADNTGLNEVNAALDTLNEYSDRTIYNFGQMTRNIGTFTAAGVDLDTAVQSIKGISNLAAISGSSAEQAATAMYQLSQAVSTGTLRLMDWNSVVNAGMGGEVFQRALFETGVAMGTITDAPVGTTFEEWTAAGNSFRDSLQEGWLTGEVLTNTLAGFTGELTEAQLLSIGYTREQAASIIELGQTGVEAATKIRTFSQLLTTIKETIGSGWSQSFRAVFGDFEEASQLFTNINEAVSGFVNRQAEARNELLEGWKAFGGRDLLIRSLSDAFESLGEILTPIREAFRDIFPRTTVSRLLELTEGFADFTRSLRPSETTIENVRRIFTGLFAALDVGWEIVKNGVGFLKDLVVQITGLGSGNILEFTADIADFFTKLRDGLDQGESIRRFFDDLTDSIQGPIEYLRDLREAVFGLFNNFDSDQMDRVGDAAGRFGERFSTLRTIFERLGNLWEPFANFMSRVFDILSEVGEEIGDWFSDLGETIADAMETGDFEPVLDAINTGLLGGIALLIARFLRGGINFDLGGGVLSNISNAFEELTGVLSAMQANIRSDTLIKIAGAVALLTASVVALSLIDSQALSKALFAMAVGFTELMGAFAILNVLNKGIVSGATFSIVASGMILLSTAIVILAGAVAILGTMEWDTLAKGLTSVSILLGVLTGSAIVLSKNAGSILLASVALNAMSTAITILAGAVAIFGTMNWDTLAKGFAGVTAGLLIMATATHLMPKDLVLRGAGLILIATALNILAGAVATFATMEWDTLAKGFAAVAAGLVIIGLAMQLMPSNILLTGAGLLVVSVALNILAGALLAFSTMSWEEIGKGLATIAGALLILAVATNAMSGAVGGAAAIFIVSSALAILAGVLISLSKVPFGDLLKSIAGIAIALTVFGVAATLLTPAIGPLFALSAAMLLLGGAAALFGVGALAAAKAFEILAKVGPEAAEAVTAGLKAIAKALPAIGTGLAEGILEFIQVFVDAAPRLAEALGILLNVIIEALTEIIPEAGDLFLTLVRTLLRVIVEATPDVVEAGIQMIIAFLDGIRDNIDDIVEIALDIITEFLTAIADNIEDVILAGVDVLVSFLSGITENIGEITQAASDLITTFITAIASFTIDIVTAGANALASFLNGMAENIGTVTQAAGNIITTFITEITRLGVRITNAGTDAIVKFATGITNNVAKVATAVTTAINTFIATAATNGVRVVTAGADALIKFTQGISANFHRVVKAGVDTVIEFIKGITNNVVRLAEAAADLIIDFLNELADVIREKGPELVAAGRNIADAVIDGIIGGFTSGAGDAAASAGDIARGALDAANEVLDLGSPSKEFMKIGRYVVEGFALGMSETAASERSATALAKKTTDAFRESLSKSIRDMDKMGEFNPVVTPVLDLTRIRDEASNISGLIGDNRFVADLSSRQASLISSTNVPVSEESSRESGSGGVTFTQTINAPTRLSTSDIYKQTRNQITLAKEELDVP